MDTHRRACRLAASAPTHGTTSGSGSRKGPAALALLGRVGPEGARQLPAAVPVPSGHTAGSRALLIQRERTREMAELQQITLFKTESPKYIRIDIIKQGSVDRKVQCHPHQDP